MVKKSCFLIIILLLLQGFVGCQRPPQNPTLTWEPTSVVWSHDESMIAIEETQLEEHKRKTIMSRVHLIDSENGSSHHILPSHAFCPIWIDEKHLLFLKPDSTRRKMTHFRLLDSRSKQVAEIALDFPSLRFPVVALPEKRVLTLASEGTVSEIVSISKGTIERLDFLPQLAFSQLNYNREESSLAFFCQDRLVVSIVDVASWTVKETIRIAYPEVHFVHWTDNDNLLLIVPNKSQSELIRLNLKENKPTKIANFVGIVSYLSANDAGLCALSIHNPDKQGQTTWEIVDWKTGHKFGSLSKTVKFVSVSPNLAKILLAIQETKSAQTSYLIVTKDEIHRWLAQ